jgi:hypothetical protein
MYAGHFAAGLAIKATEPRAPTWALLLGAGLLDVLFPIFAFAGLERARVTPGQSPGFALDFIDWSHSLTMALVWSIVFALGFARRGIAIAAAAGAAVFSHFVLDVPMHPADMALWPHSAQHVGFGLWHALPHGWWFVELGVIALLLTFYVARARKLGTFGGRAWIACAVVLILHAVNSPWLAPTR